MLPEKFLNERNVVRIDFTVIENNNQKIKDNTASIISKRELMGLKDFPIDERYVIIGAVVISSYEPPDLYYFNGVKINKGKFDRIKLENPNFKYYVFYDEVIGQKLSNETDMNKLFLLYSN